MRRVNICTLAVVALGPLSGAYGQPMNMATGSSSAVDGYLRVGADEFGSFNSVTFSGIGDTYNPADVSAAR